MSARAEYHSPLFSCNVRWMVPSATRRFPLVELSTTSVIVPMRARTPGTTVTSTSAVCDAVYVV